MFEMPFLNGCLRLKNQIGVQIKVKVLSIFSPKWCIFIFDAACHGELLPKYPMKPIKMHYSSKVNSKKQS